MRSAPILRAIILVLAVAAVAAVAHNLSRFPRTEDAEVRANVAGVAPQVGGSIVRLHVTDNQDVRKGDLLFELDARPYEAEAARARARLELARLEVRALGDDIMAAEATLRDRAARTAYAAAHVERLEPLLKGNYASADRVQRAKTEAESARALTLEAEAAVARAKNKLGEFEGRNTRIEEAEAALRDAELRVGYCKIYAPCDGQVTNLQIAPGTYAAAGEQVFSLVDSSVWYVLANFRETDLTRIRPGQRATVFLMADRSRPVAGIVQGIARAIYPASTGSRDAPGGEGVLSQVQPTFDFVQLARRFPVRIIVEGKASDALRMGGRAAVVVDTESPPDLEKLQRKSSDRTFVPPAGP